MFSIDFNLWRFIAASGIAIAIAVVITTSSINIVQAERVSPLGSVKYSCSSGTACVEGNSTGSKTWGVYGAATSADGVHGTTNTTGGNSGVAGISTSTSGGGHGVYGSSANGAGVYGTTSSSSFTATGVEGHTTNTLGGGYGVAGYAGSHGAAGVYGNGIFGVFGEGSDAGAGVVAISDSSTSNIFYGYTKGTKHHCVIDGKANLTCTGDITGGPALRVRRASTTGQRLLSYASESTSATIEDVGTAHMFGGVANVQISPDFASVMDRTWYYVFLTPLGDTRGLYVSMKTASAFQVREIERGRDSLAFDYRIVAHPLGANNTRLPAAPDIRVPADVTRAITATERR